MTSLSDTVPAPRIPLRTRLTIALIVLLALGVVVTANAHLVYVAFASQPQCVTHLKHAEGPGAYAAAKSAC